MRTDKFILHLERVGLNPQLSEAVIRRIRDNPDRTTKSLGGLIVKKSITLYRQDIGPSVTPYGYSGSQSFGRVLQETRILGLPTSQSIGEFGSPPYADLSDVVPLQSGVIKLIEETFKDTADSSNSSSKV